jgi:siderophore synthetase component
MLARDLPGVQYVNNITDFPKALGNSAAGVVRKRLRAPLELRLCLASFRGMMGLVFKPPLRLARDVTVRTLDDAAEFARTYVGPRLPHRRDRVVHRFEEISDEASARVAARAFRAWAISEGLLAEES